MFNSVVITFIRSSGIIYVHIQLEFTVITIIIKKNYIIMLTIKIIYYHSYNNVFLHLAVINVLK